VRKPLQRNFKLKGGERLFCFDTAREEQQALEHLFDGGEKMKTISKKSYGLGALVFVVTCIFLMSTPASAKKYQHKFPYNPVIFVHGGAGSGAQFESQAMRFTSNGYPQDYINVLEYDSSSYATIIAQVWDRLDQLIAQLQASFGVDQVDLLGHSLGTAVCQGYLAFPARAANVAHYVNIDGGTAAAQPGGVPTLALWAELTAPPGREITGAWNVTIPRTTHTQVATCAESFYYMYNFFTGKEPKTIDIVPEPLGLVRLAGRAVYFPQNTGVDGGMVEIYEVNGHTGARLHRKPKAVYFIGEDGNWGPFKAKAGRHYEFDIVHPTGELHPFYFEPFIRSNYLIRLNTSPEPGGGASAGMDRSENHSNLVVSRNKEFWGDQGINNDILAINGVNVVNAATCPTQPFPAIVVAMFVYDQYSDEQSDPAVPIPEYAALTFFTGVDLYLPGAYPPDGTIRLTLIPRGGNGLMQVINVPNWASSQVRRISIQFNDFVQDVGYWTDYVPNQAKNCTW
jgi:pimeloyl-ACP methyl ester carboxylesterase